MRHGGDKGRVAVSDLGKQGLIGWRERVGERVAPAVAARTPLTADHVRALLGLLFFALSLTYVVRTLGGMRRQLLP